MTVAIDRQIQQQPLSFEEFLACYSGDMPIDMFSKLLRMPKI